MGHRVPEGAIWADDDAAAGGLRTVDVPFVSIGGGLASFAVVNFLRIAGVPQEQIRVIGRIGLPHDNWRYLVRVSQIPDDEPLRSDSMSSIDNIWGWPSYALRQAAAERTLAPLWRVLTEPILSDFFNPKAGHVYRGLERESARIGWSAMLTEGEALAVRRRRDGGYFVVVTHSALNGNGPLIYRCQHVHLGLGYPGVRFLPDLRAYRDRFADPYRFVNSYEPHEHVYRALAASGGTVLVRGAGIVASRVLQRLSDERDKSGAPIEIVHLLRRDVGRTTGRLTFRRPARDGFSYQPFTFAKAAGGGQLRFKMLRMQAEERAAFIKTIGGTTTADRRPWRRQLERGRREGWYRLRIGKVTDISPNSRALLVGVDAEGAREELHVDYIIDATGLDPSIREHPLLADLLDSLGAGLNAAGRLDVGRHFEVAGTRSRTGRLYASGASALGGYLAPVDSFWGFQHAALDICDDLARNGFCKRIGPLRSTTQWWRWMRNKPV